MMNKPMTAFEEQYPKQAKRIEELETALQAIVDKTPANEHKKWPHHHWYLFTARTALKENDER